MFDEAVDKLLRDLVTPEAVIAAERGAMPADLWSAIEQNGLTLAAVPEALGGVGAAWGDCLSIVRLAGYHAVPLSLAETLTVNWLLGKSGAEPVRGAASLGLAHSEVAGSARFTGSVTGVPWGGEVQHLLVSTADGLVLLATQGADVTCRRNVAGEPRDTLHFTDAEPLHWIERDEGPDPVLVAGAMIRTAQIAGGLARLRDICVDYVQQRVQFGKAIAKFQAVQHNIARLAEQAALANAAAGAAFAAEANEDHIFLTASAKQVAGDAAGEGAALAHAVVGAIGFTQEYVLHLLSRRLWAWRAEFGSSRLWADEIGAAACALQPAQLWPSLVRGNFALEGRAV